MSYAQFLKIKPKIIESLEKAIYKTLFELGENPFSIQHRSYVKCQKQEEL